MKKGGIRIKPKLTVSYYKLVKKETSEMGWLLCLIGEKLPQLVTRRIHEYLILGFASYGNPYLGISNR